MKHQPMTFCIFAHFLLPYIERGIIPHLENADPMTIESFLTVQLKPDDERPDVRLDRIFKDAREGRRIVFCVDAFTKLATSAVQYCHTVGIPYGLVVKVNGSLGSWSAMNKQAPFTFVLGVGPTDKLPELFPGPVTKYDRSNRLTAPSHARDFVLQQIAAMKTR